jgi:hypothetical protein
MSEVDYTAPAELFVNHGRSGLRYRRFSNAAAAIKYAIEKLPADVLSGSSLQISAARYGSKEIRALYENNNYPFTRMMQ